MFGSELRKAFVIAFGGNLSSLPKSRKIGHLFEEREPILEDPQRQDPARSNVKIESSNAILAALIRPRDYSGQTDTVNLCGGCGAEKAAIASRQVPYE